MAGGGGDKFFFILTGGKEERMPRKKMREQGYDLSKKSGKKGKVSFSPLLQSVLCHLQLAKASKSCSRYT